MCYEGLGSTEPKKDLLPFDLEAALKNPERVVYRNSEKPNEWVRFIKYGIIVSIRKSGVITKHDFNGKFDKSGLSENLDLMLLPEFKPEAGKWYWVKWLQNSNYFPCYFNGRHFDLEDDTLYLPEQFDHIHPEPIKMPE